MKNLKLLISKLSAVARMAIEKSANFCVSHQNDEIDIEHIFYQLFAQTQANDVLILLEKYKISKHALMVDLSECIEHFTKGQSRTPIFAKSIVALLEHANACAAADQCAQIRSGHLLIALLTTPSLYQQAISASSLFETIPIEHIKHKFLELTKNSIEHQSHLEKSVTEAPPPLNHAQVLMDNHKASALSKYSINLTEKAQIGAIDPVIGREYEIRLMLDILMRRRQNNPILTGEPGVGKTAVVEGLALKIVKQQVPDALKNVQLISLDMGLLQAGASVKGEFENRLKQIIKEVQAASYPIILFIDEAHTIIGAGAAAGQNDAANLLKPALARGELRTIAATTWSEYKKYFEKDAALSRRFQVVKVAEPRPEVAVDMLRAMIPVMSAHFKLHIDDEAIVTAVYASDRYITERQLPDKAMSVLDTAAARVALSQNAQPVQLDQLQAQKQNLELELDLIHNEQLNLPIHQQRITQLEQDLKQLNQHLNATEVQWKKELNLVQQIQSLENQSHNAKTASSKTLNTLIELRLQLQHLQQYDPLVHPRVNAHIVNQIISDWTGIPLGKMVKDDIQLILNLQQQLAQYVVGQDHALNQLVQGIKTSKAKLEDPSKPQGVFLLIGPSGVGKTETALALANTLYGGESHLITINMSEYQEAHTVSTLKGAPPGYVGYGQGGVLTEAVRRNPYSVVLLDEIEKAHNDVQELFYQVFDKGTLEDGEGQIIDFKNTIIILTSNIGSNLITQACIDQVPTTWPHPDALLETLKPILYKNFKAAFLGRLRMVPYYPLHDDLLIQIIQHKLNKIALRLMQQYQIQLDYPSEVLELILSRCTEVDSGARNIEHILNATILPALSTEVLIALSEQKLPQLIRIDVQQDEMIYQLDPVLATSTQPLSDQKKTKKTRSTKTSSTE